jgi:hypothetical protein
MIPLTPELAVKRHGALMDTLDDRHGPIEEVLFQIVRCDGCGATVDLCVLEPDLRGWMTAGDLTDGFEDWCPACAAKAHDAPAPPESV